MIMKKEREEIVKYGRMLVTQGLTKGTGGNLSICNRKKGLMALTPSGVDYFIMKPEDVVLLDVQTGEVVEGDKVPSSECDMHRIFYKYRTDINALVHTHSDYATTIACLNEPLPAIDYLVALAGPDVRCAKYATYGTVELAKNAFEGMKDRYAVLLANHGIIVGGVDIGTAFYITEEIEFCCGLYYRSRCIGNPVTLPEDEMLRMIERFKNYGKKPEEHEEI
ncbi:MAG: fuculose phosphate aldolase [Firmicutes bacterium HGW-Firmicutes-7]|nr:MAG: fuculose phosphate aldolase [Firmicutes bacterium HGW-Firmicutes-7]